MHEIERERLLPAAVGVAPARKEMAGEEGGSSSGRWGVGRRGSGSSSAGKRRRWRESSGRAPPPGEAEVQQLSGSGCCSRRWLGRQRGEVVAVG